MARRPLSNPEQERLVGFVLEQMKTTAIDLNKGGGPTNAKRANEWREAQEEVEASASLFDETLEYNKICDIVQDNEIRDNIDDWVTEWWESLEANSPPAVPAPPPVPTARPLRASRLNGDVLVRLNLFVIEQLKEKSSMRRQADGGGRSHAAQVITALMHKVETEMSLTENTVENDLIRVFSCGSGMAAFILGKIEQFMLGEGYKKGFTRWHHTDTDSEDEDDDGEES